VAHTILARYLDPETLSHIAGRRLEPRGLVIGNLAGAHRSPLSGFAVEFAGHREYTPGDDLRHLDWRVFFTRERYVVKQYEMETNLVCHFVLDCSASMRYGEGATQKLRYAAQMIAALGYAVVRQADKVSLATLDDRVREVLPPANSMAQIIRMSELLDRCQPVEKTDLPGCLAELAGRMRRREVVMVFSDFFGPLAPLEGVLQRLRYQRHEVVLFATLHPHELRFELDDMTRFVGLEVPEELLAQPEDIRQAYLAAVERFQEELQTLCQRNHVECVMVDTGRPPGDVLADYLNSRAARAWRR